MKRCLLFMACASLSLPAQAQLASPVKVGEGTITVTGNRDSNSKVEMSDWRMAETPHVVVLSKGSEKDLLRTAHNLETLHFLLSVLTGQFDQQDETIKIAVTMIGDAGDFEQIRLADSRWQYGPFPKAFPKTIYYDPRVEGSVLAGTQTGANIILQPSRGRPSDTDCQSNGKTPLISVQLSMDVPLQEFLDRMPINEVAFCQSAESRLYSAFAQNFLMTYFPAAYPRWYLQGFGEMFATMEAGEGFVEYGHLPPGYGQVMNFYKAYPVEHILDGHYLTETRSWTPHQAWRLVHLLYFSKEWKPKLLSYLAAKARGEGDANAAVAFGDPGELQQAVNAYRRSDLQYERLDFSPDNVPEPSVRQLTQAEAGLVRGRLELGARVEVPAEQSPNYSRELARRTVWLEQLRDNAQKFPNLIENQLLLAEAECRVGNSKQCLEAADRVLARLPTDTTALVWKGTALMQLALLETFSRRQRGLEEARRFIVQANRLDPEGVLPLISYYNSFAEAGDRTPDIAVQGLWKVADASPAAPSPRLKLGKELLERNLEVDALKMLLPVAKGPFETPEQPVAAALLKNAE